MALESSARTPDGPTPATGEAVRIAQVADDAPTFQAAARALLAELCGAAGWDAARLELRETHTGVVWSVQPGKPLVRLAATAARRRMNGAPAELAPEHLPRWHASPPGSDDGTCPSFLFPVLDDGRAVGSLECFSSRPAMAPLGALELSAAVAEQAGAVLLRKPEEGPEATLPVADAVTSLPCRDVLLSRLQRAMDRTRGSIGATVAVVHIDVDRFKWINDALGRAAGDALLRGVARRFREALRGALLARAGADEFAVLLERVVDPGHAVRTAERVQRSLSEPFTIDGQEIYATACVGVAFASPNSTGAEDVLRDAETATGQAKGRAPSTLLLFEDGMRRAAAAQLRLDSDLRRALHRKELNVCYQPVVALGTGQVAGFEALARWKHPELGMVPPSRFIPIAEETGLIAELGINILREACQGMRLLQVAQQRPLNLGVNLSAPQLFRPGLVDDIASVLGDTGMDPAFLQIEVTESVLVDRIDEAADVLRRLRKLRVRIAMDDFGTGYSSLAYLHALPIDVLKIDRSFVAVLGEPGGRAERLVQSIVALGRSLELEVIAEGVETAAQRAALERLGCELAQGFHFSEAVPLAEACALLQSPR